MLEKDETVDRGKHDRRLEFGEFLDQVHQRVADQAKGKELIGILRLGNVWRLRNAEASITQDSSSTQPGNLLVTLRTGPDSSLTTQHKVDSVDSAADVIVDGILKRQYRFRSA
jgi:hypothetical protein